MLERAALCGGLAAATGLLAGCSSSEESSSAQDIGFAPLISLQAACKM
jgi:hypothetical protein